MSGGGNTALGYTKTGGYYDGSSAWTNISTTNAPAGRANHTVVMSSVGGMIVWGGVGNCPSGWCNDGAKYVYGSNTWTAISSVNAPTARSGHSAVLAGTKMIIWGGGTVSSDAVNTGAIYDIVANTWTPMSTVNAPPARFNHTAVWTGTKMIIAGGIGPNSDCTGMNAYAYDLATDTWSQTSSTSDPGCRYGHVGVWTGNRLIIWGGIGPGGTEVNTGAAYNPVTDKWTALPASPISARSYATGIWYNQHLYIGGGSSSSTLKADGAFLYIF